MADDTDTIEAPPRPVLPPGSGYTYSTQGPGDFSTTRMVGGPGGVQVPLPQNAQNFASVQGAPGPVPDPQTEMLRNVFNKLPVDQAIKAVQAAHQYQGQRLYQRLLGEGKTAAEALSAAGPLLFGGGINPTELAKFATALKPPQMNPYQQAEMDYRNKALAQQAVLARERMAQDKTKPGAMTQQQVHEMTVLGQDRNGLQKELAAIMSSSKQDPKRIDEIHSALDDIRDRQNELLGKPPVKRQSKPAPEPEKPSAVGQFMRGLTQGMVSPGMVPGTPSPAAATATPQPKTFPAAPAKEKRVAGQIYQTPQGPHKWTGKGWEPLDAPAE